MSTFNANIATHTSLQAWVVNEGDPDSDFMLQVGNTIATLTDKQAADLGRFLLYTNNTEEPPSEPTED